MNWLLALIILKDLNVGSVDISFQGGKINGVYYNSRAPFEKPYPLDLKTTIMLRPFIEIKVMNYAEELIKKDRLYWGEVHLDLINLTYWVDDNPFSDGVAIIGKIEES